MFFPKVIKMRKIIQVSKGKNYKISLDEEEIKQYNLHEGDIIDFVIIREELKGRDF